MNPDCDLDIVPEPLKPKGGLSWELPKDCESYDTRKQTLSDATDLADTFQLHCRLLQEDVTSLQRFVLNNFAARKCSQESDMAGNASSTTMVSRSSSPTITSQNRDTSTQEADLTGDEELDSSEIATLPLPRRVQSLRRRQAFGPYELFWMRRYQDDGQRGREAFSTLFSEDLLSE